MGSEDVFLHVARVRVRSGRTSSFLAGVGGGNSPSGKICYQLWPVPRSCQESSLTLAGLGKALLREDQTRGGACLEEDRGAQCQLSG